MAKRRFRDVKQGRISDSDKKKRKNIGPAPLPLCENADKSERFKAFITDTFMLLMPIMYIVFYLVMDGREGFSQQKLLGWLYIVVPYITVTMVFLAKTGQTPGMRAYDIKVVNLADGKIPPPGRLFVRQALGVADFLFFGWVTMFFRRDHRTPHEILTHTALIRTQRPGQ